MRLKQGLGGGDGLDAGGIEKLLQARLGLIYLALGFIGRVRTGHKAGGDIADGDLAAIDKLNCGLLADVHQLPIHPNLRALGPGKFHLGGGGIVQALGQAEIGIRLAEFLDIRGGHLAPALGDLRLGLLHATCQDLHLEQALIQALKGLLVLIRSRLLERCARGGVVLFGGGQLLFHRFFLRVFLGGLLASGRKLIRGARLCGASGLERLGHLLALRLRIL